VRAIIVTGDLNSDPADTIPVPPYPATLPWAPTLPVAPPYWILAYAGFTDAWLLRPQPAQPGCSCCQAETLDKRAASFDERIGPIFSLTPPMRVLDMKLLGDTMGDKTLPPGTTGPWPSDHASLAAKLQFD
jgi:hypothetical protein